MHIHRHRQSSSGGGQTQKHTQTHPHTYICTTSSFQFPSTKSSHKTGQYRCIVQITLPRYHVAEQNPEPSGWEIKSLPHNHICTYITTPVMKSFFINDGLFYLGTDLFQLNTLQYLIFIYQNNLRSVKVKIYCNVVLPQNFKG